MRDEELCGETGVLAPPARTTVKHPKNKFTSAIF